MPRATSSECHFADPVELRSAIRSGRWLEPTINQCPGFVQCNLVVLPRGDAFDFLLFAQRNPKACPVIEVMDPGDPAPKFSAAGADLRTDLGRYAICRKGCVVEAGGIMDLWREDSVAFLIGSSLSFDYLLEACGVPRSQVWVLDTEIPTAPAGKFHGPLVVTMRWMTAEQAILATRLTARYPLLHGTPMHIGDPSEIGAKLTKPLYGPPVTHIPKGVTPVFWACGVTPKRAALDAGVEQMITHVSGRAFVTDLRVDRLGL